jgi:hypothetical protein
MYSKTLLSGILVSMTLFILSCASKKDDSHGHEHHGAEGEDVWKEMDDFHMIMVETFHPYKDSSNLEPAKARAAELMTAADEWASATLPERVDNADVRSKLEKLKSEAAALAEGVKSADDNVIGEQLTRLHHTFHEIQEAWYEGR